MSLENLVQANSNDLVVIGSSAGGIEALNILVANLPNNFPAPLVIAQHLDPHRPSNLGSILQRRTKLPIETITSSSRLEAGKIYVVPSNRHVSIIDGRVELQKDGGERPVPSVDRLLSTAANNYGEKLIAVILTGSGSDGANGAVDVKNLGGTVIIQNPETARYPSMPAALPPTLVDFTANIEQMGQLLYDLLTNGATEPPDESTEDALQLILAQVSRQVSIDFRSYKTTTILRRIKRRMAVTHQTELADYEQYLQLHPEEIGELVQAFLINVTQFFRDPEAFAYLKDEILPKLIAQAREHDCVLRLWSVGCATGEEPYSLAMLLTDLLGAELPLWSIKIFATDLDEIAINFARRGLYSENLLKDIPSDYRERFFERIERGWRISKTLRQLVIFGKHDLSRSAPFPRINLVVCRNVLIYFRPELQDYVLNQFRFSLSPDGYLLLGKAETVRPAQSHYELLNKSWKVYRCTGSRLPSQFDHNLSESNRLRLEGRTIVHSSRGLTKGLNDQDGAYQLVQLEQLRRFNELLLRFLPVGLVVIDRSYHLISANGTARRLLGLREVVTDQDFLHAVRGIPYAQVRTAIDTVFRERNILTLPEVELDNTLGGNGRFLSFAIASMQMEADLPELVAIIVNDVTEQVETKRRLETIQTEQTNLMTEISTANRRLNDMNKELVDSNEELQVANEELVLTHEELQATIEEFETTNEELQATNEELETNNEELQATNEELQTTNDELRARTTELQELAGSLETERVRLAEIVELAPFNVVVLNGPNLLIEAVNPIYVRQLQSNIVLGHFLEDASELLGNSTPQLVTLCHETYQDNKPRRLDNASGYKLNEQGETIESFFNYSIVPSHDTKGKVIGVIIYAVASTV